MTTLKRFLHVTLSALGDTAADVADFLAIGGWSGLRNDPMRCPIAIYLKSVMPNLATAAASVNGISITTNDGESVHIATPPGPATFIAEFDNGAFDELAVSLTDSAGDVIDDLER
jgi:hypothetical protein